MNALLSNFMTVATQVAIVFVIVALGYFGGKQGMITDEASSGMTAIAVNFVTPAVIVMSFQREFETTLVHNFLYSMAFVTAFFVLAALLAKACFRRRPAEHRTVLEMAVIYGNLGMLSLPLEQALFGSDGVFYCAAAMAVFNLTFWSYGAIVLGEKGDRAACIRRALLNPGLIGTVVGAVFFAVGWTIPEIPASAMNNLSNLNMPMCMLVIGQRLSKIPLRTLFDDKIIWKSAALRLIVVPVLAIAVQMLLGVRGPVAVCAVISTAAPAAASVNMLAIIYGQDDRLASKTVSMHMVLSMLTMPVVIALAYGALL